MDGSLDKKLHASRESRSSRGIKGGRSGNRESQVNLSERTDSDRSASRFSPSAPDFQLPSRYNIPPDSLNFGIPADFYSTSAHLPSPPPPSLSHLPVPETSANSKGFIRKNNGPNNSVHVEKIKKKGRNSQTEENARVNDTVPSLNANITSTSRLELGQSIENDQLIGTNRKNKKVDGRSVKSGKTHVPLSQGNPSKQVHSPSSSEPVRHLHHEKRTNFGPIPSSSGGLSISDNAASARWAEEFKNETYECLICSDSIATRAAIWSCGMCYRSFHSSCVDQWYKEKTQNSSGSDSRMVAQGRKKYTPPANAPWPCPYCSAVQEKRPRPSCFCGKVTVPEVDMSGFLTPHSCGEVCRRTRGPVSQPQSSSSSSRDIIQCTHHCTEICHPGRCLPCTYVGPQVPCGCGRQRFARRCGEPRVPSCGAECGRRASCGFPQHTCHSVCHQGPCGPCGVVVLLRCGCGAHVAPMSCAVFSSRLQRRLKARLGASADLESALSALGPALSELFATSAALLAAEPPLAPQHIIGSGPAGAATADEGVLFVPVDPRHDAVLRAGEALDRAIQAFCDSNSNRTGSTEGSVAPTEGNDEICWLSCPNQCGKLLSCGAHHCDRRCHGGPCPPCPLAPGGPREQMCACGHSPAGLGEPRRSCTDPLRVCGRPCGRQLRCEHRCQQRCHNGPCGPCFAIIETACACHQTSVRLVCSDAYELVRRGGNVQVLVRKFPFLAPGYSGKLARTAASAGANGYGAVAGDEGLVRSVELPMQLLPGGQQGLVITSFTRSQAGPSINSQNTLSVDSEDAAEESLLAEVQHERGAYEEVLGGASGSGALSGRQVRPNILRLLKLLDLEAERVLFSTPFSHLPALIHCERQCSRGLSCGRHTCQGRCCPLTPSALNGMRGSGEDGLADDSGLGVFVIGAAGSIKRRLCNAVSNLLHNIVRFDSDGNHDANFRNKNGSTSNVETDKWIGLGPLSARLLRLPVFSPRFLQALSNSSSHLFQSSGRYGRVSLHPLDFALDRVLQAVAPSITPRLLEALDKPYLSPSPSRGDSRQETHEGSQEVPRSDSQEDSHEDSHEESRSDSHRDSQVESPPQEDGLNVEVGDIFRDAKERALYIGSTQFQHVCLRTCDRKQNCKIHKCPSTCHRGDCLPCGRRNQNSAVSCPCGRTPYPSFISCGQELPKCPYPCRIRPKCGHPAVPHSCHPPDVPCPSCTRRLRKHCPQGHVSQWDLPCSAPYTCSSPCGALLPCGRHNCHRVCHARPAGSGAKPDACVDMNAFRRNQSLTLTTLEGAADLLAPAAQSTAEAAKQPEEWLTELAETVSAAASSLKSVADSSRTPTSSSPSAALAVQRASVQQLAEIFNGLVGSLLVLVREAVGGALKKTGQLTLDELGSQRARKALRDLIDKAKGPKSKGFTNLAGLCFRDRHDLLSLLGSPHRLWRFLISATTDLSLASKVTSAVSTVPEHSMDDSQVANNTTTTDSALPVDNPANATESKEIEKGAVPPHLLKLIHSVPQEAVHVEIFEQFADSVSVNMPQRNLNAAGRSLVVLFALLRVASLRGEMYPLSSLEPSTTQLSEAALFPFGKANSAGDEALSNHLTVDQVFSTVLSALVTPPEVLRNLEFSCDQVCDKEVHCRRCGRVSRCVLPCHSHRPGKEESACVAPACTSTLALLCACGSRKSVFPCARVDIHSELRLFERSYRHCRSTKAASAEENPFFSREPLEFVPVNSIEGTMVSETEEVLGVAVLPCDNYCRLLLSTLKPGEIAAATEASTPVGQARGLGALQEHLFRLQDLLANVRFGSLFARHEGLKMMYSYPMGLLEFASRHLVYSTALDEAVRLLLRRYAYYSEVPTTSPSQTSWTMGTAMSQGASSKEWLIAPRARALSRLRDELEAQLSVLNEGRKLHGLKALPPLPWKEILQIPQPAAGSADRALPWVFLPSVDGSVQSLLFLRNFCTYMGLHVRPTVDFYPLFKDSLWRNLNSGTHTEVSAHSFEQHFQDGLDSVVITLSAAHKLAHPTQLQQLLGSISATLEAPPGFAQPEGPFHAHIPASGVVVETPELDGVLRSGAQMRLSSKNQAFGLGDRAGAASFNFNPIGIIVDGLNAFDAFEHSYLDGWDEERQEVLTSSLSAAASTTVSSAMDVDAKNIEDQGLEAVQVGALDEDTSTNSPEQTDGGTSVVVEEVGGLREEDALSECDSDDEFKVVYDVSTARPVSPLLQHSDDDSSEGDDWEIAADKLGIPDEITPSKVDTSDKPLGTSSLQVTPVYTPFSLDPFISDHNSITTPSVLINEMIVNMFDKNSNVGTIALPGLAVEPRLSLKQAIDLDNRSRAFSLS